MGLKQSVFSQNELKLYQELSALDAAEINHAYRRFKSIDPLGGFQQDKKGGISFITVADNLKELKVNPFRYRLCKLFCAGSNGLMNFDDFLDLVSVLNDKCSSNYNIRF
jgi:calcium and integrin-binding protein 1